MRLVHAGVEFHGVAELAIVAGHSGARLQRVPESVREQLNPKAAARMLSPDGAEIRFVTSGDRVEVTLSCSRGSAELIAFWGLFQGLQRHPIGARPTTVSLQYPERVSQLDPRHYRTHCFQPRVWRLTIRGLDKTAIVHFHDIRGVGLRPPPRSAVPACTLLGYGTSVTDGFAATGMHLTYLAQAARRLGMDMVNLGSAGSAYCEPALAGYMAARPDWSVAVLEISLNMIGAGFCDAEFRERAHTLINAMAADRPDRSVVCITPWPYFGDLCVGIPGPHGRGRAPVYGEVLRELVAAGGHSNVHLAEGAELFGDCGGYSVDLAHPADYGMIRIGERLARCIAGIRRDSG